MKRATHFSVRIACAGIFLGLAGAMLFNHYAIGNLRRETSVLAQQAEEASRLARENQDIENLRILARDAEEHHEANRDLPRLRNDVRVLRERVVPLRTERARNEALINRNTAAEPSGPTSQLEGFIPKANLADAGFD